MDTYYIMCNYEDELLEHWIPYWAVTVVTSATCKSVPIRILNTTGKIFSRTSHIICCVDTDTYSSHVL